MPTATVRGNGDSAHGEIPEAPSRTFGVGRGGHTVELLDSEVQSDGRYFVRVCNGPSKNCTYRLPEHELYIPDVQPMIDLIDQPLPHDAWQRLVDDPESATCPHILSSNRETVYDTDLGLWVHGTSSCRRPSASHLRAVAGIDGMRW